MKQAVFLCRLGAIVWMAAASALAVDGAGDAAGNEAPGAAKAASQPNYTERILAAARAGDAEGITRVLNESFKSGANIGMDEVPQMLNGLLEKREGEAFRVLLGKMRETNLGKDWQPNEQVLAGLVKDGRKDLIDSLLASRLDLHLLEAQKKSADPGMAAWMGRRLVEVTQQRAEIDQLVDACKRGDTDMVLDLLDAGVDVNCRVNDGGWTPLTRAASASRVGIVRLLLDRGAQVDLPKYPGWDYTPLCLTSSVKVANILKDAGANVHANLFGRETSILTYVAMWGGAPMVQWFLDQGLDPKLIGDNDETLLFYLKDAATAEILLKAGVDPNRPNEFGQVPLATARSAGVVWAMVKAGAKLDGMKYPLLPGMIQMSKADAVEAVLQAGAPQDVATMQKALIRAAHMDNEQTAEVLLRYGAKANEPGELSEDYKMLPLEMCCVHGSIKVAKVLLAHGADPNAGDKPGMILRTAISNRYKDLTKVLKEAGAIGASDLTCAIALEDIEQKAVLLASAPDYAEEPEFWDGVISAAAKRGDRETVAAALQRGVPVYFENSMNNGYAAAAFEGQWEVLELLLGQRSEKADPEELRTALWNAVWNSHPYEQQRPAADFEKCVRMLLEAGAPVARRTQAEGEKKDYDLVQSAVFTRNPGGNWRVIEMLVAAGAEPDPEFGGGLRLSEYIAKACQQKSCSTPDAMVVKTLEKLRQAKNGK